MPTSLWSWLAAERLCGLFPRARTVGAGQQCHIRQVRRRECLRASCPGLAQHNGKTGLGNVDKYSTYAAGRV